MAPARVSLSYLDLIGVNGTKRVTATLPRPRGRPFLKWAGGKQWASPLLGSLVPDDFSGMYYEPFLGAGATYFAAAPENAQLSDANADLIDAFRVVRDNVEDVIALLRTYKNDRDFYNAMRRRRTRTPVRAAARFIYLNKTAFNGLYRVNRDGAFNVPFGRFVNPTICQPDRLQEASDLLQGIYLLATDFQSAVQHARAGDIVYFDPPYITGHTNNGFLKYNARLFSWDDQVRLSRVSMDLRDAGVRVIITNSDHPGVIALYKGFYRYRLNRPSVIGGPIETRRRVSEALLSSEELLALPTEVVNG